MYYCVGVRQNGEVVATLDTDYHSIAFNFVEEMIRSGPETGLIELSNCDGSLVSIRTEEYGAIIEAISVASFFRDNLDSVKAAVEAFNAAVREAQA